MHLPTALGLALALASSVTATPPKCGSSYYWDGRKCASKYCSKVLAGINAVHQQTSAIAFCSSYLHIPISTIPTTVTKVDTTTTTVTETSGTTTTTDITTTTGALVTVTESTTTTFLETPTSTISLTTTSTSIVTTCPSPTAPPPAKRGIAAPKPKPQPPKPKPKCISTYQPGAALSSACSCLSIKPSTTTSTSTASQKTTITETTTVPTTEHATTTVTTTDTATTTTTFSETTTSTVTTTELATSTTYVPVIPTFNVLVYGGDRNGNYLTTDNSSPVRINDDVATSPAAGQQFTINADNNLVLVNGAYAGRKIVQAGAIYPSDPYLMYVDGTGSLTPGDSRITPVSCVITSGAADGTCPLACSSASSNGGTQSWDCAVWWRLGVEVPSGGCYGWTPYIVTPP